MRLLQKERVLEDIKNRRQNRSAEILTRTKLVREKITKESGQWDAVTTLRDIRYAS